MFTHPPITSARDLFKDYQLRHPRRTIAIVSAMIIAALYGLHRRRNRHRQTPLWFRALVVWPLAGTAVFMVASVVLVAAGIYLAPRGYRWARAKWEARR